MALSTYAELKTALQAWVDGRSDVTANAEDFIVLAEAHFNLELRCRQMWGKTTLTPTGGAMTLPDDFEGVRRVVIKTSPRMALDYISPDVADEKYDSDEAGYSSSYTIIGDELLTYPNATADIELTYLKSIPALSDSNASNWLLTKYPNIYLETAQLEAYRFFKMDNDLQISAQRVLNMIERLNEHSMLAEYGNAGRVNDGVTP